ncbi:hypothetical protein KJ966_02050 [bacterium]|nr:hypothetical protein [bacterium]
MKKRKQTIVNRDFQLKKTLGVTAVVSVIISIIIISVGVFITINNNEIDNNNAGVIDNISRTKEIMDLHQSLWINLLSLRPDDCNKMDQKTIDNAMKDYNNAIDKLNAAIESNENLIKSNQGIMKYNNWLIMMIILFFIIGIAILYNRVLEHTHRISGPIFVMTRIIKEALEGKDPQMRDLREKDDFKEFHELFRDLIRKHVELAAKHPEKE